MSVKDHITFGVKTTSREELVDITGDIKNIVKASGVSSGICHLYVPHTTAGVTINENADPSVRSDIIKGLKAMVPDDAGYTHAEGNSPAHIKSTLTGCGTSVFIEKGEPVLGRWQGIYFCEYDGPRRREVKVKITGEDDEK
jgi:secondary thiamine-phosphate synthase enzyme